MKQNLKYGIIVLFAILLHSFTMKAADILYTEDVVDQECFISQANSDATRIAYEHFHLYGVSVLYEMGHADISHVPTDKSFFKTETCFHKYMLRKSPSSDVLLHLNRHSLSDPLTYYVYELRKIII